MEIGGDGTTCIRTFVIEQFYANACVGAKAGDEDVGVENTAEMLLFDAEVLACPGHFKVQQITVKLDASASVGDGDRSVVDAQKKAWWKEPAILPVLCLEESG